MKSSTSVYLRIAFIVLVTLAWLQSMFPLKNKDFMTEVQRLAASSIAENKVDEAAAQARREAASKAAERDAKEGTAASRKALIAAENSAYSAITNKEVDAFNKAVAKAKELIAKRESLSPEEKLGLSPATALTRFAEESNLELGKFIPVPGNKTPSNKAVAAYVELLCQGKLKLGIDLQGGVEFTVAFDLDELDKLNKKALLKNEADKKAGRDPSEKIYSPAELQERIIHILEARIGNKGLSEAEIRPFSSNTVLVRIPVVGEDEVFALRGTIEKQARLSFRGVYAPPEAGLGPDSPQIPPDCEAVPDKDRKKGYWILKIQEEMDGTNISDASAQQDGGGNYLINKSFNSAGAAQFREVTSRYAPSKEHPEGLPLAIVLDGVCYSAPYIKGILSSSAQITGGADGFSKEEAEELALVLKSGALIVPIHIDAESRTSATLGEQAGKGGLMAAAIGIVIVMIFMIAYYRVVGVIASVGLILNIILLVGSMMILGASFSLPAIAAVALTMGMAVDANILIYERMKEELEAERVLENASKEGFSRAFAAIFDSNVTTLLTAALLAKFGSGPVQAFGIAISIGILTTMFTAVFVTKVLLDWYCLRNGDARKVAGLGPRKVFAFDYWKVRRLPIILSIVAALGTLLLIGIKGKDAFSVDFTGGNAAYYEVSGNAKDTPSPDQYAAELAKLGFANPKVSFNTDKVSGVKKLEVIVKEDINKFPELKGQDKNAIFTRIDSGVAKVHTTVKLKRVEQTSVGGIVGWEFAKKAMIAFVLAVIGSFLYIAFRFESTFAFGAIVAMLHDITVPVGIYVLFGGQISIPVVAAVLTIIGYSLNDTIIVFDRIREDAGKAKEKPMVEVMNYAINHTLSRTILTSLTVFFVVGVLCFGGGVVDFAVVMLLGVLVGCYSSIFIAAPVVCNSKMANQLARLHDEDQEREAKRRFEDQILADDKKEA
ncbi:MAG: hypothetical protein RL095_950 [Verrucomicrobiota bacterium]|jgi:SecD/SecF fusion protein